MPKVDVESPSDRRQAEFDVHLRELIVIVGEQLKIAAVRDFIEQGGILQDRLRPSPRQFQAAPSLLIHRQCCLDAHGFLLKNSARYAGQSRVTASMAAVSAWSSVIGDSQTLSTT